MRSLATKYRPKTFKDVVAQTYVKEILESQLEHKDFKNAYLFTGGAGTGKTTTARILAKDVNGGVGTPIEIDGASNNGVDNIRDIIEECKYRSLDSEYKVFIIDEVHMLSIGAFNALLKTLEEPPANTIFILCTTDPQKIPATILSRVQRFDFKRIPNSQIVERLEYIIHSEIEEILNEGGPDGAITYEKEALDYIAKLADGGMRDSITMLDKVLGYTMDVTFESVVEALGAPDYTTFFDLLKNISEFKTCEVIYTIERTYMNGKDLKLFIRSFTNFVIDLTKFILTDDLEITSIPSLYEEQSKDYLEDDLEFMIGLIDSLSKLCQVVKWEANPKQVIEAELILLSKE